MELRKGHSTPECGLSDPELHRLITEARAGNQESLARLLDAYRYLIVSLTNKYTDERMEREDAEEFKQDATIAFYKAVRNYDLEQSEVTFGLYAKVCIANALCSAVRAFSSRKSPAVIVSLDEKEEQRSGEPMSRDLMEDYAAAETLEDTFRTIRGCLSANENAVWCMHISGYSTAEIASAIGKDKKSVSNSLARIRAKLRKYFKKP